MKTTLIFEIWGMREEMSIILLTLSIAASLALTYYWVRFIFDIKRQLWNQRQQINLLLTIAVKLGVDENDPTLRDISSKNNSDSNQNL